MGENHVFTLERLSPRHNSDQFRNSKLLYALQLATEAYILSSGEQLTSKSLEEQWIDSERTYFRAYL